MKLFVIWNTLHWSAHNYLSVCVFTWLGGDFCANECIHKFAFCGRRLL